MLTTEGGLRWANEIKDHALLKLDSRLKNQILKMEDAVRKGFVDRARIIITGQAELDVITFATLHGIELRKYSNGILGVVS